MISEWKFEYLSMYVSFFFLRGGWRGHFGGGKGKKGGVWAFFGWLLFGNLFYNSQV